MPDTLLSTKLHIPRPHPALVHRPHLIDRLEAGLTGRLTLVSAPAGYGKTTLVSDWIYGRGERTPPLRVAWLSLDAYDNDLANFLTYLIAALQLIDESIGAELKAIVGESQAPPESLLARLVHEIEVATWENSEDRAFVLVLDDYHLIKERAVHHALRFLIDHLPPPSRGGLHTLIAGRTDPPLPISRLRVQGQVTEIRSTDLRFSVEEATALLNERMGLDLSPVDVAALDARTEGWVASLQLAAMSLRGREDKHAFIAAFSGSHRYVLDYLMDEVMARQPPGLHTFLRQTSVLDRFCAPLCDAALGISSSREVLRQLEDDNLFLIPLDDERRWYRYHHLFAGFLAQSLREREPDRVPGLHRRASRWYEAEGAMDDATEHALAAGDLERATRLVDQIAALLVVRRNPYALLRWIDRLPSDLCQSYPMLCVWHAWALLFVGQLDAVEPVLQIAESHRDRIPHLPIPGYATTIRAYLANQRGDLSKAIDLSEQALEQMSDSSLDRITLIFRGAAIIWLGVNHRHLGNLDRARQLFVQATSINLEAGNIYAALATKAQLADMALVQGQLHQAVGHYRQGLQMAQEWADQEGKGSGAVLAASELHLGLGTVLYQRNDLAGAAPHIHRAVELGELGGAWERMYGYRMLAYLKQAEQEYATAHDLLQRACAIRDTLSVRQLNIATEPGLEQLRILLARAQPDMAHLLTDVAERIDAGGWRPGDDVDFGSPEDYAHESDYSDLARSLIALGRAGEAMPLLERLLEAARSMERQGDAIRYLGLQALAFHALGDISSARASLGQALPLAKPEGYVRIFVDEGAPMAELLRAFSDQLSAVSSHPSVVGREQSAARQVYVDKLLAAFGAPARDRAIPPSPIVEPLSARELEVLRLMTEGDKFAIIAERLFISLNTVRHHTRNIYGKLGAHSRAQAIARARELGLL
jgi:LuxR family maltose regulon positive regulatory protein